MNFKTVPVTVQAMQWEPTDQAHISQVLSWLIFAGLEVSQGPASSGLNRLCVGRAGCKAYAASGDWIVLYPSGDVETFASDVFESKFLVDLVEVGGVL